MKKNITFNDLANETGFSKTTISRYFNSPDTVTLESQQKIEEAMQKLGYKANKVAKILASGKTEFIGIIIPKLYNHFYSELLNSLLSSYSEYGYKFIVFAGDDNPEIEKKYIEELLAYKIEGLIVLSHTISSAELKNYGVPIVCVEREASGVMSVETDNYFGGCLATQKLIDDGCECLFHINSPISQSVPAFARITAFEETTAKNNVPAKSYLRTFENNYDFTYERVKEIYQAIEIDRNGRKAGVFTSNDTVASYLVSILLREGKKIPSEYEIVGFDNSSSSYEGIMGITTISQSKEAITKAIMDMIDKVIKNNNSRRRNPDISLSEKVVLSPEIIIRETTLK